MMECYKGFNCPYENKGEPYSNTCVCCDYKGEVIEPCSCGNKPRIMFNSATLYATIECEKCGIWTKIIRDNPTSVIKAWNYFQNNEYLNAKYRHENDMPCLTQFMEENKNVN